jgi:hypothetical protein
VAFSTMPTAYVFLEVIQTMQRSICYNVIRSFIRNESMTINKTKYPTWYRSFMFLHTSSCPPKLGRYLGLFHATNGVIQL